MSFWGEPQGTGPRWAAQKREGDGWSRLYARRMPSENEFHKRVCDALIAGVQNRDWFLWVNAVAPDDDKAFHLDVLCGETREWLAGLDPDERFDSPPSRTWAPGGADGSGPEIRLSALAKKERARGSGDLIGNPVPAFAYWTGG